MNWLARLVGRTESVRESLAADFVAIDVETATHDRHTICQIGMVAFHQGREVHAQEILVDPGCSIAPQMSHIHGLTDRHVRGQPTFDRVHATLTSALEGRLLVAHSGFDRQALEAACDAQSVQLPTWAWIDTVEVSRVAWPGLPNHKLPTVCASLGHALEHHQALSDARAAGHILLRAIAETGHPLERWGDGSLQAPRSPRGQTRTNREAIRKVGAGDGPLAGECVVMTGDFSAPKTAFAADIAAAGGAVATSVSRKVTIVVIGDRDASLYGGAAKSGKQARAEELIAAGTPIALMTEAELRARMG